MESNTDTADRGWSGARAGRRLCRTSFAHRSRRGATGRHAALESLEPRFVLADAPLIITEFMASNGGTLLDKFGKASDWIEIYNRSPNPVNLLGWQLTGSRDPELAIPWTFPAQVLPAGDYLVVFASNKDIAQPGGELHTNFKLNADGEHLQLVDPNGTVAFAVQFPQQFTDVSFGYSSNFATSGFFVNPTPGAANVGQPLNQIPQDPSPPTTPTNLTASDDGLPPVHLSWSPASDAQSGIARYVIYRDSLVIGRSTSTSFTDTTALPRVVYSYSVSAVNGGQVEGLTSVTLNHQILPADTTPPTAPTNLVASDEGGTQIDLAWSPAIDTGSGVREYIIYRDNFPIASVTGISFSDKDVVPGLAYAYRVLAIDAANLYGPLSPTVEHTILQPLVGYTLRISTRSSYLPGVPLLVQVEILGSDGRPAREIWDAGVRLASTNPAVTLQNNFVHLRNGLGSLLVSIVGDQSFGLVASSGGIQASRTINSLAGQPQTIVPRVLSGVNVTWSGIVHLTDFVTVPVGTTLTVQPGTLVLVDGIATPKAQDAPGLIVEGTLNSLGTAADPVTFTATNVNAPWGQIAHVDSRSSLYQYTQITRAGHSTPEGHTSSGPAFRTVISNTGAATITFDHVMITDLAGKTLWAGGNRLQLVIHDSHFARAAMGPEIDQSSTDIRDTWITEMLAKYREDGENDDDDGLYLRYSGTRSMSVRDSVIALVDDDGIDTLDANVLIDNVIVRDATNLDEDAKGISTDGATVTIRRALIVNTKKGIVTERGGAVCIIDHSTIVDSGLGIEAGDDYGISMTVTNSIVRAIDSVSIRTRGNGTLDVSYSDLGETWPGDGNITEDPMFVNEIKRDFRLRVGSPAINAGAPSFVPDADGSRTDMGAHSGLTVPVSVAGRWTFYNNSVFDGDTPGAAAFDDAAIATDKAALLPGHVANFGNYTSYSRGLNGVMIDLMNYAGNPTAADFVFRVGNDNNPAAWPLAPAPMSVSVRALPGSGHRSRVSIVWSDGAIQNQWLQVTAKTSLGLVASDVFYFGDAIGEAGNLSFNTVVDASDELLARNNPRSFVAPALVTDNYDFNRDGFVNAADQIIARSNPRAFNVALKLIEPEFGLIAAEMDPSAALSVIAALAEDDLPEAHAAIAGEPIAPGTASVRNGVRPIEQPQLYALPRWPLSDPEVEQGSWATEDFDELLGLVASSSVRLKTPSHDADSITPLSMND